MASPDSRRWTIVAWPAAVVFLVVLPAWIWIARDDSVWPWDTAHLGNYTVNLWATFNPFSTAWWDLLLTGMTGKAPGLPWLSQPFVGLGHLLFGDALPGLLLFQVLVQTGSALLMFRIGTHVAGGHRPAGFVAACVLFSAPLSLGLSVRYYTEPLQMFFVTYLWWATITIPAPEYARRGWHAFLALTLGAITKVSTPLYVVLPLAWLAYDSIKAARQRLRPETSPPGWRLALLKVAACASAALSLTWLALGYGPLLAFVRSTSSGAIASYYGNAGPLFAKLGFWLGAIERELASSYVLGVLAIVAIAAAVLRRTNSRSAPSPSRTARRRWVTLALLQVALALVVMARQVNQDVRYLAPLLPGVALLAAIAVNAARNRWLTAAAIGAGLVQYAVVALQLTGLTSPGLLQGRAQLEPPRPGARQRELLDHTINALRDLGGPGRSYTTAIDVINFNTNALELHTALQRLQHRRPVGFRSGFSPYFADFDYILGRLLSGESSGIITLAPDDVPPPTGMPNQLHGRVFDLLTHDERFVAVPAPALAPVLLFKPANAMRTSVPPPIAQATARRPTDQICIDVVAGRAPTPGPDGRGTFTVTRPERATLAGWAWSENTAPPPPRVFLELVDPDDHRTYTEMARTSRPDVAAHFQQPQLERSGIVGTLDTGQLAPGLHQIRIVQVEGETLWEPGGAIYWLEVK